jgi:hypothetical protein
MDENFFELEEFTLEGQKKEPQKNYGYGEGDRSIGQEFLERFPQHTIRSNHPHEHEWWANGELQLGS